MQVCEAVDYFLDLPRRSAQGTIVTIVLWVFLTDCYHVWSALPCVYIGGLLRSGKSRMFEVLERLCFRPLVTSNLTAAALFRSLHSFGITLLLGEAERLKRSKDADVAGLLSLLLAGHKAGGSDMQLEPVGDNGFKTVSFDVFGPKALACIGRLPAAIASRSISITMFRSPPESDKPRRRIDAKPEWWTNLRDQLHVITLEHGIQFLQLPNRVDVCPVMSGRNFDVWQPLLALAAWLNQSGVAGLLELMQAHSQMVIDTGVDRQVPDHDETLLRLLTVCVRQQQKPTSGELLDRARELNPESFRRWSAKGVAECLRRHGLTTIKSHERKRYARVTIDDLAQVQESYGFDLDIGVE